MRLDETAKYLIGVGAAAAAQCERCQGVCVALARQCGAEDASIRRPSPLAAGSCVAPPGRRRNATTGAEGQSRSAQNGSDACCGSTDIRSKEGRSQ